MKFSKFKINNLGRFIPPEVNRPCSLFYKFNGRFYLRGRETEGAIGFDPLGEADPKIIDYKRKVITK